MKKQLRLVALLVCIMMLALAFVGCGKKAEEAPATEENAPATEEKAPEAGEKEEAEAPSGEPTGYAETINIAYFADLDTADPYMTTSSQGPMYTNSTFRSLREIVPETGELKNVLAESVEDVSGNNTCFEVKLRQGVKFHDGTDFTAEDVVFTWNYAKDVANVSAPIMSADDQVKTIEAVDDYTVRFNLNYGIPDFPDYMTFKIYSKDAFDTMDPAEAGVIGCGPYKVGELVTGVSFALERFEDYNIPGYETVEDFPTKNIVFKVIPDDNAQAAALQAGEVDGTIRINSAATQALLSDPNITVHEGRGLMNYYIGFKFAKEKWCDPELRKAIAMAVNKDDIISIQFENGFGASRSDNWALPSVAGYKEVDPIDYDPEAAKAKIAELGYAGDNVTIMTVDAYKAAAEVLQANLGAVGLTADIKIVDATNWPSLKVSEDYDIDIGDYGSLIGPAVYSLSRHLGVGGTGNMRGHNDPEYEALLQAVRDAKDYDEVLKTAGDCQDWLAENVPFIPYAVNKGYLCARSDVQGVAVAGTDNYTHCEYWCKPIYS
ncbi:MAG: ABC transporter substrate-binding protein [Christensenellaceae bacterium]|nr:ABC transporter substrate-binding protein [Christensenellaceae bacterium]